MLHTSTTTTSMHGLLETKKPFLPLSDLPVSSQMNVRQKKQNILQKVRETFETDGAYECFSVPISSVDFRSPGAPAVHRGQIR